MSGDDGTVFHLPQSGFHLFSSIWCLNSSSVIGWQERWQIINSAGSYTQLLWFPLVILLLQAKHYTRCAFSLKWVSQQVFCFVSGPWSLSPRRRVGAALWTVFVVSLFVVMTLAQRFCVQVCEVWQVFGYFPQSSHSLFSTWNLWQKKTSSNLRFTQVEAFVSERVKRPDAGRVRFLTSGDISDLSQSLLKCLFQ